jgi:predicted dehydrogenase
MATSTATLGVGIIGTGRVSGGHAKAVKETATTRLVAAADVDQARVDKFAEMNYCDAYTDYNELLKRDDIDFVIIALPHWLHYGATVAAAAAKKHIFIEKPMAMTLDECDRMAEAADHNGVKIMVGHSEHYMAPNITARRILHSGQLGDIVFANDVWYKPFGLGMRPPWFLDRAQGGGMWQMNGAHMLDRITWLMDSKVTAVKAWIGNPMVKQRADDSCAVMLDFASGAHAVFTHTGYAKEKGNEWSEGEYILTEGMLRVNSRMNAGVWTATDGNYEPVELDTPPSGTGFTGEITDFARSILEGTPPPIGPEYARHIMDVLLAAEKSSETGREVVIK